MIKITSRKFVLSFIASLAMATTLSASESYGTVNGQKITKEDVSVVLRNPNIDLNSLPKETKDKVINQVIEKKLLTQNAVKSGVNNSSEYKIALEKLKQDLALEFWMKNEFKKVKVTEQDKKDYYNKNKAQFKVPATLEARHILVKTEKDAKDLISSLDKAKNKKDEFIKLAKTKSVGPSGPKGGYLGKFPETQMVPAFSKAAKALGKGKYSKKPVKTQFGYHVIYLEDKEASKNLKYDEVKQKIQQALVQEKFRKHVKSKSDSLRKTAKIVIK